LKTIAIIQARMGSSRLPGKTMSQLGTKPLIDHVLERARVPEVIDEIYLATTTSRGDDILVSHVQSFDEVQIYRGSEIDVRSRFTAITEESSADLIVRITSDDPFKDPFQIVKAVNLMREKDLEYICNFEPRTLPIGMDIEVFTAAALAKSNKDFDNPLDREHVTWSMRTENFLWESFSLEYYEPNLRLTVDLPEDFDYCSRIAKVLHNQDGDFSWQATKLAIEEERQRRLR